MNVTCRNWLWLGGAALALAYVVSSALTAQQSGRTGVDITLTRVIQLPVSYIENGESPKDRLALSAGAEDELAQGPASFDVLGNGGVVVTDPLKQRLVYFDSEARFVKETALGFTPREVWLANDGTPRVQSAGGQWLEPTGNAQWSESGFEPDAPKPDSARRTGPDRGFVLGDQPGLAERSGFTVLMPGGLASIEKLGRDARGRVYVALEVPISADEVAVSKMIRKCAADGSILAEIRDVPLDYFVNPVREFRLKSDGKLYQLMPQEGLVAINMWDTSRIP